MSNFASKVKTQIVEEIHRPARKNCQRRKVILKSLLDLMQADLVEMREYEKKCIQTTDSNPSLHGFWWRIYGKGSTELDEKYNIIHYVVYSEKKASIVERVNRTLESMMWKEFSIQESYKWVKLLPKIVNIYNNKKHRTIGLKPSEITKKAEKISIRHCLQ